MKHVLNGTRLAEGILARIAKEVRRLPKPPRLLIISWKPSPASLSYIAQKEKRAREAGIMCYHQLYKGGMHAPAFRKFVGQILQRVKPDGAIIQLPLPASAKPFQQEILDAIPEVIDVDCLSTPSRGKLSAGSVTVTVEKVTIPRTAPIAGAVLALLASARVSLKGALVVVIGWGDLVGKPLVPVLLARGASVSVGTEFTKDIARYTKEADVVISGVGKPYLIRGSMIKRGAVVIDCGTSITGAGVKGDVHMKSVQKKAKWVSPVPGGVGPLTVAIVLKNTFEVAHARTL